LTGEEVRDTVLALSGQLDLTMGGPPAVQFVSKGDATFNTGGNPRFSTTSTSIPTRPPPAARHLPLPVPHRARPILDALDCPDGGAFTPVRNVSTTAVQAFAMLNDTFSSAM